MRGAKGDDARSLPIVSERILIIAPCAAYGKGDSCDHSPCTTPCSHWHRDWSLKNRQMGGFSQADSSLQADSPLTSRACYVHVYVSYGMRLIIILLKDALSRASKADATYLCDCFLQALIHGDERHPSNYVKEMKVVLARCLMMEGGEFQGWEIVSYFSSPPCNCVGLP